MKKLAIILLLLIKSFYATCQTSPNLLVPRETLILLRDEAKLGLQFRVDNRFLRGEIESLKREIALLEAQKTGKDSVISKQAITIAKLNEIVLISKQQANRYKKQNRIVFGPGYGVGIGKGMIHHMAGVHATINVFSFLRL